MCRSDDSRSYRDPKGSAIESRPSRPPVSDARLSPRQRGISAGGVLLILGGLLWLALNNPLSHSFLPRCPTEQYAGFYCPGCGATRATHHLLQGRPGTAMGYNPLLVVVGAPLILFTLVSLGCQAATGRRQRFPSLPGFVGWAAVVGLIGFSAARNLPGEAFEALRPTPVEADREAVQGEADK